MKIAETFGPVIQGEGFSAGVPAVFLRFAGCNLDCGAHGGTWACDSREVWKRSKDVTVAGWVEYLKESNQFLPVVNRRMHVVLTGGEPLLHVDSIKEISNYFASLGLGMPYFEIETNGSIYSDRFLKIYIEQVNCSLKLENSGEPIVKRINPRAIQEIIDHPNSWFKFVVSNEFDWEEISQLIGNHNIPYNKIILMPAGATRKELYETGPIAWKMSCDHLVRYCDRYQVRVWDNRKSI